MMEIDYFPRVVVTGDAFCNRTTDRKLIGKNLMIGRHLWIQAHRRHGKTSLINQVIEDLHSQGKNILYERCHLLFNTGSEAIISKLLEAISKLSLGIIETNEKPTLEKLSDWASNTFRRFSPHFFITDGKFNMNFTTSINSQGLLEALKQLDVLAVKHDIRAVLMVDEFQEIGLLPEAYEIESAIREVVELAKATTFVFCGSEATLMVQAMGDKKRPLYRHTEPFLLERISPEEYTKHLNKLANGAWGQSLSENTLTEIFNATKCHPYYINWLCGNLWTLDDLPTDHDVNKSWADVVRAAGQDMSPMFSALSINEKKMLKEIASGTSKKLMSAAVTTKVKINASSVRKTIMQLTKKTLIDKNQNGLFVIDPALISIALQN